MARTPKDTVDYFPHYCNASDGDTLTVLEGQFGNDGFTFWFKLLEKLGSTDGHFIDCSQTRKWQVLCARARVKELQGVEIMNLLVEMGAIDKQLWETNKIIWCQNFVDNVAEAYRNRKRDIPLKPLSTPNNQITTPDNPLTTPDNTQTILDYTKLDKTKEESSLSIENIIELYKKMVGFREEESLDEKVEDDIKKTINIFPPEWVRDAIQEAIRKRKHWGYVIGILDNWRREKKRKSQDPGKYTKGKYGHLVRR